MGDVLKGGNATAVFVDDFLDVIHFAAAALEAYGEADMNQRRPPEELPEERRMEIYQALTDEQDLYEFTAEQARQHRTRFRHHRGPPAGDRARRPGQDLASVLMTCPARSRPRFSGVSARAGPWA